MRCRPGIAAVSANSTPTDISHAARPAPTWLNLSHSVDEASLWPKGQYVTTQLIVTTSFLSEHPDVVQKLVNAQVAANDYIKTNVADAEGLVSAGIQQATGKPIDGNLVIASFKNIEFTNDPIASSLVKDNKDGKALGFPAADTLKGLYNLSFLNKALKAAGEPLIPAAKT